MPTNANRKIISLETLTEFKNKYDQYVANTFAPLTGQNVNVDWGTGSLKVQSVHVGAGNDYASLYYDGEYDLFGINHAGFIEITNTAQNGRQGIAITTPGLLTYNGVEVATKSDVSSVLRFKGNATISELETLASGTTLSSGDTYNITAAGLLDNVGPSHTNDFSVNAGDNVAWVQPSSGQGYWDVLAGTLDTSNFVTNSQLNTALTGYLPLSGGTMNGPITMGNSNIDMNNHNVNNVNSVVFGPSSNTFGSISYGRTSGSEATGWLKFLSDNAKYHFATENSGVEGILSFSKLETASRTFSFPDESGTLVTGEYATTGEVQALFN